MPICLNMDFSITVQDFVDTACVNLQNIDRIGCFLTLVDVGVRSRSRFPSSPNSDLLSVCDDGSLILIRLAMKAVD